MNFADKNSTDQELDNLFRRAHANELPPPPFNNDFFSEIESLLPPVEKKRKGIIFWWTIPAAAILIGLFFGFDFGNQVSFNFNAPIVQATTLTENETSMKETNQPKVELISDQTQGNNTKTSFKNDKKTRLVSPFKKTPFDGFSKDEAACKGLQFGRDNYTSTRSKLSVDPLKAKSLLDEKVIVQSIPLTELDKNYGTDYFVQFGLLIGQSPRKDVSGNSDLLLGFSAGAGMKRYVKNIGIEFGVNYRFEHLNNAIWNDQVNIEDPSTGVVNTYERQIDIQAIHSVEFPLVFSFENPRNSFGFIVSPGIQLLFNGDEYLMINQEKQRSRKSFNPNETSSSLTMEMGLQYSYNINEHFSIVSTLRTDILRPFNQENYSGVNTLLPINGQVGLRYRF
jgi:hypothetical protein